MQPFLGSNAAAWRHDTRGRLGILLVNFGTPDSPTPRDVRRFLREFLWDPRVVEMSRPLWWLILHGAILRVRPRRSAHAYAQIWTPQGSPLLHHSKALAEALGQEIKRKLEDDVPVALGMTYGNPSIPAALEALHSAGVRRLVVLPLYPQYSGSTSGSVFDRVNSALSRWRWIPELRFITQYHDEPAYIDAIAASVLDQWRASGAKHLLFSFHGLPQRFLLAGDPYFCQCHKTARLVAESLGLKEDDWTVSFQSRVGRDAWLKPYTDEVLARFAAGERPHVTVVCPGFATDCLETLEEIALRNRADFLTRGGEALDYVAALNATPAHAELLSGLIMRHAQGWPETNDDKQSDESEVTAQRAQARGAPQ